MATKPKALVLDSWAILAYYEGEPAGEVVAKHLAESHDHAIPLLMSIVNVGEVWYTVARRASEQDANRTVVELRSLGIQFDNVEWALTRQAAVFKSKHKMSYADAFAAALAKQKGAHLLTGDHEFKPLEAEVKIIWVNEK